MTSSPRKRLWLTECTGSAGDAGEEKLPGRRRLLMRPFSETESTPSIGNEVRKRGALLGPSHD